MNITFEIRDIVGEVEHIKSLTFFDCTDKDLLHINITDTFYEIENIKKEDK
jgi:hypothetical protein